jgi:hypothetical protein
MQRLWLISVPTLLFLGSVTLAAQTMSGNGAKQCGDFMQAVRLKSDIAINGYISWAQGFISGFNWANVSGKDVIIDPAGLKYWLVNYCGTEPEVSFYQAVQQLISEQAR